MNHPKQTLQQLVPPALWQMAKERFSKVFRGDYTWEQAEVLCGAGYANTNAVEYALTKTKHIRPSVFIESSVLHLLIALEYSLAKDHSHRSPAILDFGGSMGGTYFLTRHLLAAKELSWYVIDLPATVELAKRNFEDQELRFENSLCSVPDLLSAIVASSSLQYCAKPYTVLEALSKKKSPFLIIDRIPLTSGNRDVVAIQTVSKNIYAAQYPVWFLSERNLLSELERLRWVIKFRWECNEEVVFKKRITPYQGMLLEKAA